MPVYKLDNTKYPKNMEYTLSIIKPDGIRRNLSGKILAMIQDAGLEIVAQKLIHLTRAQAEKFYAVHAERPFFNDLCSFMASGPVSVQVLKSNNAVSKYRELMGATNPKESSEGTIRKAYGLSIDENTVHGSDSVENAKIEIALLFSSLELFA